MTNTPTTKHKDAEELLKLIEAVDPSDTGSMKIIDYHVWSLVDLEKKKYDLEMGYASPKYTRCRTTLKSIRPEGWKFDIKQYDAAWSVILIKDIGGLCLVSVNSNAPTEELAELHAIIQAIAHERRQ